MLAEDTLWPERLDLAKDLHKDAGKRMQVLTDEILVLAPDLPQDLDAPYAATGVRLYRCAYVFASLRLLLNTVDVNAEREGREPDLDEVRRAWTLEERLKHNGLEWTDVVSGDFIDDVEEALDRVEAQTYEFAKNGVIQTPAPQLVQVPRRGGTAARP